MEENPKNNYGKETWISFIVSFVAGLVMQLGGLVSVHRDYGGYYLWWSGTTLYGQTWIILIYYILTPVCFILLSFHLHKRKAEYGTLALIAGIGSVATGLLWAVFYLTHLTAVDLSGVALSIFYWSGSFILFGITFILVGIMIVINGQLILTRLTGLAFTIVGIITVVIAYIGGFTFLPWFSVYEFPWVTTAAIIPCCLALVLETKSTEPLEQIM